MSKMNSIHQFDFPWILFEQSVFSSQGSQYVLYMLHVLYRHFSLNVYHTINVPIQWFNWYKQVKRDVHCVYHGFRWENTIHCRHLPEGSALFFR